MQTPYDSALRVQRRAVDALRLSLLAEVAREHAVDAACTALEQRIDHEATVAAADWQAPSYQYMSLQVDQRRSLASHRIGIDANLGRLRNEALEACGLMQAILAAAADFSAARVRREAGAEQAQSDDFAGTRIAAARNASTIASRPALAIAGG